MEKEWDRRWNKLFASVHERFKTRLKNEEQVVSEFSNHQWKYMFSNIMNDFKKKDDL